MTALRLSSISFLLAGLLVLGAAGAPAQPADEQPSGQEGAAADPATQPPQVLTSDLYRRITVESRRLTADFVVVDSDTITEVTVNGEPVEFEPADTVTFTRDFEFTRRQTLIEVSATDEQGNTRTRSYLVTLPGAEPAPGREPAGVRLAARVDLRYEVDTNPSNDLSTPVPIEGVDVEGTVPDEEQEDTRTTLQGTLGAVAGPWSVFGGAVQQTYSKSENEDFNTQILFAGAGYSAARGTESGFVVRYLFSDINLGEFDYVQQHTLSPGYEVRSEDEGERDSDLFALDYTLKDFASDAQDDGAQYALRWRHTGLEPETRDRFRNTLAVGTSTQGVEVTDYNYVALDSDWRNIWDVGFRLDAGFGYQYRDYPNDEEPLSKDTPLGDTRVDNLLRFSLAPGWQFNRDWAALFHYRYLANISNKSPYVRSIYGLIVQGAF